MNGERLNAFGPNGRSCPICYRVGSLTGDRAAGAILECKPGCYARFRFEPGENGMPDTLERVPSMAELYKICRCCGSKHWEHGPDCRRCVGVA